jgi:hypothetical protein
MEARGDEECARRHPAVGALEAGGLFVAFQGRLFMSHKSLMMRCRHDSTKHSMKILANPRMAIEGVSVVHIPWLLGQLI